MTDRVTRSVAAAVAAIVDRLAADAAALPGEVAVERRADGVVLSGRGLALRLLGDASLRDLAAGAGRGA